jgi:hypothetical protein
MNTQELRTRVSGYISVFQAQAEDRRIRSQARQSRDTYYRNRELNFYDVRQQTVKWLQENGCVATCRALLDNDEAYEAESLGDMIQFADSEEAPVRKIIVKAYPKRRFGIFVSRLRENPADGIISQVFEPLYDVIKHHALQEIGVDGDELLSAVRAKPFATQVKAATVFAQ